MEESDKTQLETIIKIMNDAVVQARNFLEDEEEDHTPEKCQVHVDYLQQKIAGVERTAASIMRRKQVEINTEILTDDASVAIRDLKLAAATGIAQRRANEAAAAAAAAATRRLAAENAANLQVVVKKPPLPPMQIPRFTGDPMNYANFNTIFEETIHKNDTLGGSQKLLYLQSFMDGDAKKLIGKLLISDANYDVARDLLRTNYGQPDQTVTTLYQRLHEIPRCRNEPFCIRDTYNEIEAILQMLENAGIDVNNETFLRQSVYRKFPFVLIRQMVRTPGVGLKELRELLRNEVEMIIDLVQTTGYAPAEVHRTKPYPNKNQRNRSAPDSSPPAQPATKDPVSSAQTPAQSSSSQPQQPVTASSSSQYQKRPWNAPRQGTNAGSQQSEPQKMQRTAYCPFCQGQHHAEECDKYATSQQRTEKLGTSKCHRCFRQNHEGQPCIRNMQCKYCPSFDHNRALCPVKYPESAKKCMFTDKEPEEEPQTGLFMTLIVKASNPATKKTAHLRVMVDQACNTTCITDNAAKKLGVQVGDRKLQPSKGMGDCPVQPVTRGTVDILLHTIQDGEIAVPVHITSKIASDVPVYSVEKFRQQYPDHGYIIPPTGEGQPIDIILGTDLLLRFLTLHKSVYISKSCQLLSTRFGHLIVADRPAEPETKEDYEMHTYFTRSEDIVKLMWDLDLVGLKNLSELDSEYEERALKTFYESIRMVDGRYEVHWPWRTQPPNLNENFGLAIGRLRALLKKLNQNVELLTAYHQIILDQIWAGVAEDVPTDKTKDGPIIHYIPHHAVVVLEKSTPVRVVMDAKATVGRSKSLNENILKGTKWLGNTVASLVRFRKYGNAATSDIYHAFHQISIAPADRDAVRFLWVWDPQKPPVGENLRILRFKRVAFGIVASPFLLFATIQHHLKQKQTPHAQIVAQEMYADNLLVSLPLRTNMIQFYNEVKGLFGTMSMNMTKWKTNDKLLDEYLAEEDRVPGEEISVLGIAWNARKDTLSLRPPKIEKFLQQQPTKRIILKCMASIFDPLGWITPFVVWIRRLLRELWIQKFQWDTVIQNDYLRRWEEIKIELEEIPKVCMKRMLFDIEINEKEEYELHTFVDASAEAMGCVAYLRSKQSSQLAFVMAKTRLTPTVKLSIPRLEFCALLLGVRMQKYITESLHLKSRTTNYVWSDSKCVLTWITSNKLLPVAVEKHLVEVHNAGVSQFRYVPTELNPADVASRGALLSELMKTSWLQGPEWLLQKSSWPQHVALEPEIIERPVEQPILFIQGKVQREIPTPFSLKPEDFSQWKALLRRTAFCIGLLHHYLKKEVIRVRAPIDHDAARRLWLRWDQRRNGSQEEDVIKSIAHFKHVNVSTDADGIMRCSSRLQNAKLPWDTVEPVILVKGSKITELIVMDAHVRNFHSGTSHTLAVLRRNYWLVHGRREVFKIIKDQCLRCKLHKAKAPYAVPEEPPLPPFRVTETSHPFQYTGIDVFGHMWVYAPEGKPEDDGKVKRWVLLLTCLVTRAVHFEILEGMDTLDIIAALKRFISRRGTPKLILSDNAPQFHLVNGAMSELWKKFSNSDVANAYFADQNIVWKFTPEGAPWMGGAYERLVQVTKLAFKKTYGEQVISEREFLTTIIEIEGIINNRPIVYVDQHLESPVLTPNHFLRVSYPAIPVALDEVHRTRLSTKQNVIECWKASEKHMNFFWRIWAEHYLLALQEQQRKRDPEGKEQPKVGDLVLMIDPAMKRGCWRKGIIERLIYSADGKCRSAQVFLNSKSRMIRPILKLIPVHLLDDVPPTEFTSGVVASGSAQDADTESAVNDQSTVQVVLPRDASI